MIFVGSCNGLICQVVYRSSSVWICNPITREYVMLPDIEIDGFDIKENNRYGTTSFGYVSSTNEYKVLRTYVLKTEVVEVYVYTLGSGNGWRNLGKFDFGSNKHFGQEGINANGALYWMDFVWNMIVSVDLAEEKFCGHLSPPIMPQDDDWDYKIGVLNGFLYFCFGTRTEGIMYFDIWLLKKKDANHDTETREEQQSLCWSKEFRVDNNGLLAVTKSDGILTYADNYLNIYNTETSTTKRLAKFESCLFRFSPHKNTLVSLKELGEEETKTMAPRSRDCPFRLLDDDANPECIYL